MLNLHSVLTMRAQLLESLYVHDRAALLDGQEGVYGPGRTNHVHTMADDLESLFYSFLDIATKGVYPWRHSKLAIRLSMVLKHRSMIRSCFESLVMTHAQKEYRKLLLDWHERLFDANHYSDKYVAIADIRSLLHGAASASSCDPMIL